jgi:hypothetical protein
MSDMTDAWYQHPLSLFGGVGTFATAVLLTRGIMVRPKMSAMRPRTGHIRDGVWPDNIFS